MTNTAKKMRGMICLKTWEGLSIKESLARDFQLQGFFRE
jgi:hypothetical protein